MNRPGRQRCDHRRNDSHVPQYDAITADTLFGDAMTTSLSQEPQKEHAPMTFWRLVCSAAETMPERVILADDYGRSLTATQFRDTAERVAAGLDVAPGEVVSWQLPTTLEAAILMAALSRLDVVQNPVISVLRQREVRIITTQVKTSLFVVPESWRGFSHGDMAREMECRVLALDFEGEPGPDLRLPMGDPSTLPAPDNVPSQWVYYSSGTTAEPKGAKHTDFTLIAASYGMTDLAEFGHDTVYPIAWPFSHIGASTMLTCALRCGMKLVLFDTFDPTTTPERMAAHDPTILGSAQPFFRAYIDAQLRHGDEPLFPKLRAFTAGGAPTPIEMARELIRTFAIRGVPQSYGLTEFPIATSASPHDPENVLLSSIGKPSPGVQLRLVNDEIRLKGPQCFHGYIDPALDAAAFDEDGWLRTGDLAEIRNDYVFITGRLKDVIIRNAENISALEVEDVLLRHPDIADVAVIGLPDPLTGERLCAVIAPRGNATFDVASIAAHCQAQGLAKFKCPEQVENVFALERNAMGKILKQQIRDRLLQR
jgi:cyclohexanecarboxylate-CoA ligase